jgi:hypothetical protein
VNKKLKDKIDKYLLVEQDDSDSGAGPDEELLNTVVEFLLDIDEDSLSDDMLERYADIVDQLDIDEDIDLSDEEGLSEVRLLKKTSMKARRQGRMYYKKNRSKIAAKRKRLAKKISRLRKVGKGLSGKKLGMTKRVGT